MCNTTVHSCRSKCHASNEVCATVQCGHWTVIERPVLTWWLFEALMACRTDTRPLTLATLRQACCSGVAGIWHGWLHCCYQCINLHCIRNRAFQPMT